MVARKKRTVRKISIKRDDLQWRVSNSLLILVLGMMFFGYGHSQYEEQAATGLAVSGANPTGTAYAELPVAYMLVGTVLIVLAVSSLILYKKKYGTHAGKEAPAKSG